MGEAKRRKKLDLSFGKPNSCTAKKGTAPEDLISYLAWDLAKFRRYVDWVPTDHVFFTFTCKRNYEHVKRIIEGALFSKRVTIAFWEVENQTKL